MIFGQTPNPLFKVRTLIKDFRRLWGAVGTSFSGQISATGLSWNIVCPRLVKRCSNVGQWEMHWRKFVDWTGFQQDMKPWKWFGESSMQSCWYGFFRTNVIIAIVLKKLRTQGWSNGPKTGQTVSKGWKMGHARQNVCCCRQFRFSRRRVYAQHLLHKESFTQESFYTEKLWHREAFTQGSLYTQRHLHKETFTHRSFYTEKLLHEKVFYTNKPVHRGACTHRSFYT